MVRGTSFAIFVLSPGKAARTDTNTPTHTPLTHSREGQHSHPAAAEEGRLPGDGHLLPPARVVAARRNPNQPLLLQRTPGFSAASFVHGTRLTFGFSPLSSTTGSQVQHVGRFLRLAHCCQPPQLGECHAVCRAVCQDPFSRSFFCDSRGPRRHQPLRRRRPARPTSSRKQRRSTAPA